MKIEYPPLKASKHFYIPISNCLFTINSYLNNKDYDDRYEQHYEWFQEQLIYTNRLLSLGCGFGRETIALNKRINAITIIGIDKDSNCIEIANMRANEINIFSKLIEKARYELQNNEFNEWYKTIPIELINFTQPKFINIDITTPYPITNPDLVEVFDVIYCRYVLHLIHDDNKENVITVMNNLKQAIKPESGRIIIVEPSSKGPNTYDFISIFEDIGLKLIIDPPVDKHSLGIVEWLECNPFGYILKSP